MPPPEPLSTEITAPSTEAVCVQVEIAGAEPSDCHRAFGASGPPLAVTPCPAAPFDAATFCYAVTLSPAPEPFDPGEGLDGVGTAVDAPPPAGSIGALGPGSPDAGTVSGSTESEILCDLDRREEERECFRIATGLPGSATNVAAGS